jgi:hypothetical protein
LYPDIKNVLLHSSGGQCLAPRWRQGRATAAGGAAATGSSDLFGMGNNANPKLITIISDGNAPAA